MKTSCELPAGAGKFPPDTRRNRRQSLPAEIFACIRRYFYLRNSLPAAIAGKFARASFTVYINDLLSHTATNVCMQSSRMIHLCLKYVNQASLFTQSILLNHCFNFGQHFD